MKRTIAVLLSTAWVSLGSACLPAYSQNGLDVTNEPVALAFYYNLGLIFDRRFGQIVLGISFEELNTTPYFEGQGEDDYVVFQNRIYAVGAGRSHDEIWSSDDGLNWRREATGAFGGEGRADASALVFNGSIYLVGGVRVVGFTGASVTSAESVWVSSSGSSWANASPACGNCPTAGQGFVLQGRMWFIDGGGTSVRSSADGVSWTSNALNATLDVASVFVFNGIAYVLDSRGSLWSSADGVNWGRRFFEIGPPVWRLSGGGAVFDDRLWLSAHLISSGAFSVHGAFYSNDGSNWELVSGGCCARSIGAGQTSLIFQNRIWIPGQRPASFNSSALTRPIYRSLGGGRGVNGSGRTDFSL